MPGNREIDSIEDNLIVAPSVVFDPKCDIADVRTVKVQVDVEGNTHKFSVHEFSMKNGVENHCVAKSKFMFEMDDIGAAVGDHWAK